MADIVECTGVKPTNLWFEYLMSLLLKQCQQFYDLANFVNYLHVTEKINDSKQEIIRKLQLYDIDGDFFLYKNIILLTGKDFAKINFVKLRTRFLKVVEIE
jgi:Ca2+-binding EF-hand superfamily protein